MSDDGLLDLDRVTERMEEPSNRWRNRWFVPLGGFCKDADGTRIVGPAEYLSSNVHPSRDVAETVAVKHCEHNKCVPWNMRVKYLGPEEVP